MSKRTRWGWCKEYARLFGQLVRKPVEETCVRYLPHVAPNPAIAHARLLDGVQNEFSLRKLLTSGFTISIKTLAGKWSFGPKLGVSA